MMSMHGGSAMSMQPMSMSGLPWPGAAASFVAIWTAMMVTMMAPSVAPTLWRYHRSAAGMGVPRPGRQTALVAVGYVVVWAAIGVAVLPLGAVVTAAGARLPALARAAPLVVGVVVLAAGAVQLSAWKAHHLARCRAASAPGRSMPAAAASAWRHGVRLGAHCSLSCAALTATVLAVGAMDLRSMAVATAAITVERLTPAGARVARAIGAAVVGLGLLLLARATGIAC